MRFNWNDFTRFVIGCGVLCFCVFEVCTCTGIQQSSIERTTQELASHGLLRRHPQD